MGIGIDDYKFGSKNNWRRWAWNQAKERISVKPKDAIVLYLPSKQNIDMGIAKQKGFRPENMFAVERDKNIIKHLRKQKINVIDGDFNEILLNWGCDPKIDVVMADFCGGLNFSKKKENNFIYSIYRSRAFYEIPESPKTVLVLNLMRGRDSFGAELDKTFETILPNREKKYIKHRGWLFSNLYMFLTKELMMGKIHNHITNIEFYEIKKIFYPTLKPEIKSYKSSNGKVIMDSVCMKVFGFNGLIKKSDSSKYKIQKIAAAKAIRTMRLN